MEAAQKVVQDTIASKPVVVFSKSYCPFCIKVKDLFEKELKIPSDKLEILQMEDRPDCSALQAYLKELTGAQSVPRVFVKGQSVGGCDDTFRLHQSGELKKRLDEALA